MCNFNLPQPPDYLNTMNHKHGCGHECSKRSCPHIHNVLPSSPPETAFDCDNCEEKFAVWALEARHRATQLSTDGQALLGEINVILGHELYIDGIPDKQFDRLKSVAVRIPQAIRSENRIADRAEFLIAERLNIRQNYGYDSDSPGDLYCGIVDPARQYHDLRMTEIVEREIAVADSHRTASLRPEAKIYAWKKFCALDRCKAVMEAENEEIRKNAEIERQCLESLCPVMQTGGNGSSTESHEVLTDDTRMALARHQFWNLFRAEFEEEPPARNMTHQELIDTLRANPSIEPAQRDRLITMLMNDLDNQERWHSYQSHFDMLEHERLADGGEPREAEEEDLYA